LLILDGKIEKKKKNHSNFLFLIFEKGNLFGVFFSVCVCGFKKRKKWNQFLLVLFIKKKNRENICLFFIRKKKEIDATSKR